MKKLLKQQSIYLMHWEDKLFKRMLVTVFILLLSSQVFALDGKRKGFVAILGLGVAPVAQWESSTDVTETRFGKSVQILLGYGFNEKNCLLWNIHGSYYDESEEIPKASFGQGLHGIRWYHFYKESKRSVFTTLGLGAFAFSVWNKPVYTDVMGTRGFGVTMGVGYQINTMMIIELNYIHGWTEINSVEYNHNVLSLMGSIVVF